MTDTLLDTGRVRFRTGRYVHHAGGFRYPTLCERVMKWHIPIFTTDRVSCPACLRIRKDDHLR